MPGLVRTGWAGRVLLRPQIDPELRADGVEREHRCRHERVRPPLDGSDGAVEADDQFGVGHVGPAAGPGRPVAVRQRPVADERVRVLVGGPHAADRFVPAGRDGIPHEHMVDVGRDVGVRAPVRGGPARVERIHHGRAAVAAEPHLDGLFGHGAVVIPVRALNSTMRSSHSVTSVRIWRHQF